MRRREFTIGVLLVATARPAQAQKPAKRRLAILHPAIPAAKITEDIFWRGFFADLGRLGYVEGENLIVDRYSAEGHHERYPDLAREIVASHPDVIVTVSIPVVIALTAATRTIPIVANMLEDPVKAGLVASLARPGINLTGVHRDAGVEIWGKRLETLKEAIPSASTVAIVGLRGLWGGPAGQALRDTSGRLGISLIGMLLHEGTPQEIERVFAAMAQQRPDAVLVSGEGDQYAHRQLIVELAEKNRLPAMYATGDYVERGGLMGYVADDPEARTRLVDDVRQILSGAKLGDIPIYQTTKFDFVINLKTAKALGLEIPPSLVLRADKVIE
jgi:putative tryptophan/tyrosine transport system substrate-binding protein